MGQCVNTFCLQHNPEGSTHCQSCGSQLVINRRLRATKLLSSSSHAFAPREAKTFEAISLETEETVILRVVHSTDLRLTTSLLEAVSCLRLVHSTETNPGIMRLAEADGYFTWQILPGEPPSHFMVTQKVEGIPLDQWVDRVGILDEETAADWLKKLIESADALHRTGFLHQDIKPENVVFGDDDCQPVLIDLGAIRYINPVHSLNPAIRQGIEKYPIIGTPGYQASEQAEGHPNHTSDYYSIGCTLIYLLTGSHPTRLPTLDSDQDSSRIVWRDRAQVSEPFADLIDRLVATNQIYRPLTASDILGYLDDLPDADSLPKQTRRRWLNAPLANAVAFFLVTAGVSFVASTAFSVPGSISERLFSQANRLISTGAPEQAVPVLERAAQLAPDDADIRATLGLAYTISGEVDEAIDSYNVALELRPNDPSIHYNLASVYEQVDTQQAISNYQIAAQEGSPIRDEAINNLARVYILEGDLEQADSLLKRRSSDIITQAVLHKNQGWLRFEQGNFDQALTFLNQSIELDPTRPDAYCLMSIIKRRQGQANKADEITCLSLPTPEDRPEVQGWKRQIIRDRD